MQMMMFLRISLFDLIDFYVRKVNCVKISKCSTLCVNAGVPEVTYIKAVQANSVSVFIPTFM